MKFLLTNDDGIDAPGLLALEEILSEFGSCVVVAPDRHLSGCSHQTTTDRPITAVEIRPNHFALDGTPADCARIGLLHLAEDADWLLSGVNDGGNLGVDAFMSGTVAAAREATLLGRPAAALSHYRRSTEMIEWPRRRPLLTLVLRELLESLPAPQRFWNVNLPTGVDPPRSPRLVHCVPDFSPLGTHFERLGNEFHYRSKYHERRRTADSDVEVCFRGDIAVTSLSIHT